MRTYIIGNDGITLCREAPATIRDGEIVVTSKEELHAAPLNGKRLQQTLPWREPDSNFWYRGTKAVDFCGIPAFPGASAGLLDGTA
jgi:hypothetical protein